MAHLNKYGVTIVVHGITGGGAERNVVSLANYWAIQKKDVTVITFRIEDSEPYYFNSAVKRIALDSIDINTLGESLWGKEDYNIAKLKIAYEIAGNKKIISFMAKMNIRCLLANDTEEYDVFVCERAYAEHTLIHDIDRRLRNVLYPRAKRVIVQTKYGNADWIENNIAGCCVSVIPNCITDVVLHDINSSKAASSQGEAYILSCGRLTAQKQLDQLISSYTLALEKNKSLAVKLKIAGEGELEDELKDLVARLGLQKHVDFLGWREDIYSLMKGALCLVQSSAFEGFPMVILEALCSGVPVVAYDCLTGPREMIVDGVSGYLIAQGDVEGFAEALLDICSNVETRSKMMKNAVKTCEKFSEKNIMHKWDEIVFD